MGSISKHFSGAGRTIMIIEDMKRGIDEHRYKSPEQPALEAAYQALQHDGSYAFDRNSRLHVQHLLYCDGGNWPLARLAAAEVLDYYVSRNREFYLKRFNGDEAALKKAIEDTTGLVVREALRLRRVFRDKMEEAGRERPSFWARTYRGIRGAFAAGATG